MGHSVTPCKPLKSLNLLIWPNSYYDAAYNFGKAMAKILDKQAPAKRGPYKKRRLPENRIAHLIQNRLSYWKVAFENERLYALSTSPERRAAMMDPPCAGSVT